MPRVLSLVSRAKSAPSSRAPSLTAVNIRVDGGGGSGRYTSGMTEPQRWQPEFFELSASLVLWRDDEILVMKRAMGFSAGGWFFPGGHVDPGETPIDACVRELVEETEIIIEAAALTIVDVMSYDVGGRTAHTLIYNGPCPEGAEPRINDEHVATRWMTPEAYITRFLDRERLRELKVVQSAIDLAGEVARVTRTAAAAWRD